MKVLKFGGSSLSTPERIRGVVEIVAKAHSRGRLAVVVSAFGGVTNSLLQAAELAAAHDDAYRDSLDNLAERHRLALAELAPVTEAAAVRQLLLAEIDELNDLLRGVFLLRELSDRAGDRIVSYGERLSAMAVAAAMRAAGLPATAVDARQLIVTDAVFGRARVEVRETYRRCRAALADPERLAVVTGFVAATSEGQTTTLGRGGSDYTAALLGAAVDAEAIELWTDVDGVLSADPRQVEGVRVLPRLSYAELMELSHFGAKIVYPPSIHPARRGAIPLWIKNTLRPAATGTLVTEESAPSDYLVRGISSIPQVALLRLEGDGMVGVPGVAMRLFGALARCEVSVILITQGSSEHSISLAVEPAEVAAACSAISEEFALELQADLVEPLLVEQPLSVIAVVGEAMRERSGVAARLFGLLSRQQINVRAIAQGSSELNISLVIDAADQHRALCALHEGFFGVVPQRVEIALLGTGRVGSALLEQLRQAAPRLAAEAGLELRLVALGASQRQVEDGAGIDLERWRQALAGGGKREPRRLEDFFLDRGSAAARVWIDCTASESTASSYPRLLAAGVAVVAANKRPFAGPEASYRELLQAAAGSGAVLLHEATVGAGLPVLSTLADLRRTGDRLERIEGLLSGTLNAVLDWLDGGLPFSKAVRRAYDDGLTEPHPWDDLGGADVGRKLTILARSAGRSIEPEEVQVEPLVPAEPWSGLDLDSFWQRLPELDQGFAERRAEAAAQGQRLRYVASLDPHGARVALQAVAAEHPAFGIEGADNLVAFTTTRYRDSPLVVRGPGAGPEVTAAGVFADLLKAAALAAGVW